jgi:[ribosomal protein S5]-alanine N-acetyltransferase
VTGAPRIDTERLRLRPFDPADAPRVRELAGAYEVALNTLVIPHPYPEGVAEAWIESHPGMIEEGHVPSAVTLRETGELIGCIGLHPTGADELELGYWLGVPFWGRGYVAEGARALVEWAFRERGVRRVHAHHFARNPQSGAVLRKVGMRFLGSASGVVEKWGEMQDVDRYEILREDWLRTAAPVPGPTG